MGLFAKQGLRPKFTDIDNTSATATALLARSVEFATTGTAEVIAAESRGLHLVILAGHYRGLSGSVVLSKATVAKLGISPDVPVAERLKALNNVLLTSTSKISPLTISYRGAALEGGAVEGIIVSAPFRALPIIKGTGVLWLNPSRGDLSTKFMPSSGSVTAASRSRTETDPALVRKVASVFEHLTAAVAERPADVKVAIIKLFPEIDVATLEMILSLESTAFQTKPLTPADLLQDLEYMKLSGLDFGPIERVDPASVLPKR